MDAKIGRTDGGIVLEAPRRTLKAVAAIFENISAIGDVERHGRELLREKHRNVLLLQAADSLL